MRIVRVVMAFLLLLLGRQVYWLTVGLLGFLVTSELVAETLALQAEWLVLVIALVVGLLGALLAVFVQKAAAGFAGFLAGAYLIFMLLRIFGVDTATMLAWGLAVVIGVVGAVLAVAFLDWALIFLTSLAGSSLLVQTAGLNSRPLAFFLFIVLTLVGIVVQARLLARAEA